MDAGGDYFDDCDGGDGVVELTVFDTSLVATRIHVLRRGSALWMAVLILMQVVLCGVCSGLLANSGAVGCGISTVCLDRSSCCLFVAGGSMSTVCSLCLSLRRGVNF